eukprot:6180133-Prymnesium_polylepis.1
MDYSQPLVGGISVHSTPARQIGKVQLLGGSTRVWSCSCRSRVQTRVLCSRASSLQPVNTHDSAHLSCHPSDRHDPSARANAAAARILARSFQLRVYASLYPVAAV